MARSAQELVRDGFGIERGGKMTRFKTPWMDDETALRAVSLVDQYNHYDGAATAKAVRRIARKDPNARFKFGREGSPVLYVETRKPQVALGVLGSREVLGLAGPDELRKLDSPSAKLNAVRNGHSAVRAWWD